MKIDLHTHSSFSDGTDSIESLVEKCLGKGISHASLTDHDNVEGVSTFVSLCKQNGINAVSGIEFSIEAPCEVHILCYSFDPADNNLQNTLSLLRKHRDERINQMISLLQKDNFDISRQELDEIIQDGVPARPHLAHLLVNKGYSRSIADAFDNLIGEGCKYYVEKAQLTREELFSLARSMGAKTVLAHPGKIDSGLYPRIFSNLVDSGLDGIEVFYPIHSDEDCMFFLKQAEEHSLFVTQGSDNHGIRKPSTYLGKETRGNNNQAVLSGIEQLFSH